MELLERDALLLEMRTHLSRVASGTGRTVLAAGEAGIGKTSLLKALAAQRGSANLWWGACDALQTPHPLAPLHDIARGSDVQFKALLSAPSNRAELFEAVLAELQRAREPTLLVIEDAHWADDATLDFLKFIGRRIDRAPCLLVVSYRDDEVTATHPLRRVLGELPASLVTRTNLLRLSAATVESLARRALRSPLGVYAATQGNPFFVTELLRQGTEGVPHSVQDLVLGRYARLSAGAQSVARLASIVPARIERWLVDELLGVNIDAIEECLNSGLLMSVDGELFFRHELARVAIEASLSQPVTQALHAQALKALVASGEGATSLARLVHHAMRADDAAAVLTYAPGAARQAQQRGAHREAAAHWHATLQKGDHAESGQRAAWLLAYARECKLIDQLNEAIAAHLQLGELHRRAGDAMAEAENLGQLAMVYVQALKNSAADAASRAAIALLEPLPASVQLAAAYRVEAQLRMLNREYEAAVSWANKAIELAEHFGNREILAAALGSLGTATMFIDYGRGCDALQRALGIALASGDYFTAANVYSNLGSGSGELFRLREAHVHLLKGIAFSQQHEIDFYRNYCVAWLALCELYLGRWDDAGEHALDIVSQTSQRTTARVMALVALGRLRARRGDPGVADVLDEALELALESGTLQRVAPVRAARAEAAYLRGDLSAAEHEAGAALALALHHRHPWFSGELAYWMRLAGAKTAMPDVCAEPFALQMQGRWREAATAWANLACPYEQARALAEGDIDAQLEALVIFEQLEAGPAAEALRRKLRAGGYQGLPRGKRASTQSNPHQLTSREIEVLELLAEGLKNSEIAERLCRSVRTVDHHLAAAFAKLGVSSRTEAMVAAAHAGIGPQNRQGASAI